MTTEITITGLDYCYRCDRTPCLDVAYGHDMCSAQVQPESAERAARIAVYGLLRDLGLHATAREWLPGTGGFLRAVAAELTTWADMTDRAHE